MAEPHTLSFGSLVGSIYDCVLDPTRWDEALGQVAAAFACDMAILSLNDLEKDRILISRSLGWESHWLDERAKHLPEIHGALNSWLMQQPGLENLFVGSRDIPAAAYESSPYVRACLKPQGIVDVVHFPLLWSVTHFSELVLFCREDHGVISEREIELGALLLPHLRRAMTISNVLDVRTIEQVRMKEALDGLTQGVFLTDRRGAVVHFNVAARQMLQNRGPVCIEDGVLLAKSLSANSELSNAISLAGRGQAAIGGTGIAIRLSPVGAPPIYARVLPLGAGRLQDTARSEAVAAIFIDAEPDERLGVNAVSSAYGLTYAETRVLQNLVAGRTLSKIASDLGVAVTTARTHLAHIFLKTGVSRQADLVRLTMQASRAGLEGVDQYYPDN